MRSPGQKHIDALSAVFTGSADKDSAQSIVICLGKQSGDPRRNGSPGNENPAGRWVLDLSTACLDGLLAP